MRTAHAHDKPEIAAWETSLSLSASSELSVVTIQAYQKQGNIFRPHILLELVAIHYPDLQNLLLANA